MELTVGSGDHRVVVAPTEAEDPDLRSVLQSGLEAGHLEGVADHAVDVDGRRLLARERGGQGRRDDRRSGLGQPTGEGAPEVDRARGADPSLADGVHRDHGGDEQEHPQDDELHRVPSRRHAAGRRHPAATGRRAQG